MGLQLKFINQPSFKTNWMKNSYCSLVSRLWNRLPDEVRKADNLHLFKKLLNDIELDMDIYYS